MLGYNLDPHTGPPPRDVTFWEHEDSLLVTRQNEDHVTLDAVVGETRNPRVLVRYERAIVEGQLVSIDYDPHLKVVSGHHPMAGLVHRWPVDEWLDAPALVLEQIHSPSVHF